MVPKTIDGITKQDIQALLANSVPEGRTLDYKFMLPGGKDDDKKEFLGDVSSFANSTGGDLIFGISEAGGVPDRIDGVSVTDWDAVTLQLESIIRDGIEPRIIGVQLKKVEGFPNGQVLVLRIPRSFSAPHMVTFKNTSRFYTRSSAGKYQMDVGELRSAFDISNSLGERLQRFRNERLSLIVSGQTSVLMPETPKVILHILPLTSFSLGKYIDADLARQMNLEFSPIGAGAWDSRHNLDGFLTFSRMTDQQPASCRSYCQFFRSGIIETVSTDYVAVRENQRIIRTLKLEQDLINYLAKYLPVLKQLGVQPPLLAALSMLGFKGAWLTLGMETFINDPKPIDRDNLILPEVLVESYDTGIHATVRPILDAIWNASGYSRCLDYDVDGKWKPQPR